MTFFETNSIAHNMLQSSHAPMAVINMNAPVRRYGLHPSAATAEGTSVGLPQTLL